MPIYSFLDKNTGETFSEMMKYSELEEYLKENPHIEQDFNINLHSGLGLGLRKPDEGFKDLLSEMKKSHNKRGGNVNDHR